MVRTTVLPCWPRSDRGHRCSTDHSFIVARAAHSLAPPTASDDFKRSTSPRVQPFSSAAPSPPLHHHAADVEPPQNTAPVPLQTPRHHPELRTGALNLNGLQADVGDPVSGLPPSFLSGQPEPPQTAHSIPPPTVLTPPQAPRRRLLPHQPLGPRRWPLLRLAAVFSPPSIPSAVEKPSGEPLPFLRPPNRSITPSAHSPATPPPPTGRPDFAGKSPVPMGEKASPVFVSGRKAEMSRASPIRMGRAL
jgi:hypothetical protein